MRAVTAGVRFGAKVDLPPPSKSKTFPARGDLAKARGASGRDRRTTLWIVLAIVALHAGAFLVFGRMKALPDARYIPPPNFGYREETYQDARTGEKSVYREFRVSTKLAGPKSAVVKPGLAPAQGSAANGGK